MDYIEILTVRYTELKNKFYLNRNLILKNYSFREYDAVGQSACYFYIKYESNNSAVFLETAIDYLETAILNQEKYIEKEIIS